MSQQALWRKDDQWFPEIPLHLTSEQMEKIRRRGAIGHRHVVIGAKL
jgi:hypothetical protein